MDKDNPCVGLPLAQFALALSWYQAAHPEQQTVTEVDWEQVRDIADEILGRRKRKGQ